MMIAFIIVVIHFVADFIFQAEEWATNKSKSFKALVKHTAMYSFIWYLVGFGFAVLRGSGGGGRGFGDSAS